MDFLRSLLANPGSERELLPQRKSRRQDLALFASVYTACPRCADAHADSLAANLEIESCCQPRSSEHSKPRKAKAGRGMCEHVLGISTCLDFASFVGHVCKRRASLNAFQFAAALFLWRCACPEREHATCTRRRVEVGVPRSP